MKFYVFFVALVSLTCVACQNENAMPMAHSLDESAYCVEAGHCSFVYQNEEYFSGYRVLADETYIFDDEKTANIMAEIGKKPNVTMVVGVGDMVEFFDSEEDAMKALDEREKKQVRSTDEWLISSSLTIYDGVFGGASMNCNMQTNYSNLGSMGWNDRISSIKLSGTFGNVPNSNPNTPTSARVILYADPNYSSFNTVFVCNRRKQSLSINLETLSPFGPYTNKNWGNQTSSMKYNSF